LGRIFEVQKLRKLFQLSVREFWVLMQAGVLLLAVRLGLQFVTVRRLLQVSAAKADEGLPEMVNRLPPETLARLVRVAAEHVPFRARCLEQSLVLRWLLLRRGAAARIILGARKADEGMQAHAWVEVDGVTLSQDHGVYRDFAPLDELMTGS
jgi:Transglutaminase-like superfamily